MRIFVLNLNTILAHMSVITILTQTYYHIQLQTDSRLIAGSESASPLQTVTVILVLPWSPTTVFPSVTVA